ncbi:MAG: transglutaminase domain-containing protein [Candidatus Heimdallarchaeaceae archaeon]
MWINNWIKGIIKLAELKRENPELFRKMVNSPIPMKEFIEQDENKTIERLIKENKALKSEIEKYLPNPEEKYWNNKYPKINISYLRHETDGTYEVDVRDYFQIYDFKIPTVSGKTDDEKAYNALMWVINKIKYVPDKTTYGFPEYWAYPYQTLKRRQGDCEDGSILLANIMVKSGIPYWKVRLCAADVYNRRGQYLGGHCYVTYYYETGKRWVSLDWCFYPNSLSIDKRPDYKNEIIYGKGKVWFSWNMKYAFAKSTAVGIKNIKVV